MPAHSTQPESLLHLASAGVVPVLAQISLLGGSCTLSLFPGSVPQPQAIQLPALSSSHRTHYPLLSARRVWPFSFPGDLGPGVSVTFPAISAQHLFAHVPPSLHRCHRFRTGPAFPVLLLF